MAQVTFDLTDDAATQLCQTSRCRQLTINNSNLTNEQMVAILCVDLLKQALLQASIAITASSVSQTLDAQKISSIAVSQATLKDNQTTLLQAQGSASSNSITS